MEGSNFQLSELLLDEQWSGLELVGNFDEVDYTCPVLDLLGEKVFHQLVLGGQLGGVSAVESDGGGVVQVGQEFQAAVQVEPGEDGVHNFSPYIQL